MSVKPLNQRFALIVASYNCRKRDYRPKYEVCQKKNSRIFNGNVHHKNGFHQIHVLYKSHQL